MGCDDHRDDRSVDRVVLTVLSNVLGGSVRPAEIVSCLIKEVGGFTDARRVIFTQCSLSGEDYPHHVLGVHPEQDRAWAESSVTQRLYSIMHHLRDIQVWRSDESTEAAGILREEGFSLSLAVPLLVEGRRQGAMLLLGLSEEQNLASVTGMLRQLAPAVALVLRNAFLYEKQEQIIEERTANLQRVNEQLQIELAERKKTQEALARSEALYHDLVDTAQDLIWQCDAEGRYTYLNPAWETTFGYGLAEMLGRKFTDFQSPERAAQDMVEFASLMQGGTVRGFETVHLGKDGRDIQLVFNAKCVRNERGEIIGSRGTAYDVTERKRAEAALQQSESRYRTIVENINDALYVHDFQGNIREVNESACAMLGYAREELIGANLAKIDTPGNATLMPQRMKTLFTQNQIVFQGEHRRKDGSAVPVEVSAKIVTREGGGVIQGFVRDISSRLKAEQALRESELRYRNFVRNATEGIYRIDFVPPVPLDLPEQELIERLGRSAVVGEANDHLARMYGLSVSDMVGRPATDFAPAYGERALLAVRAPGFQVRDQETQDVNPAGEAIYLLENFTGVVEDGHLIHIWGMQSDITERKRAEKSLRDSEEKYRYLVETLQEGIWAIDAEGRTTFVNPRMAEMLGCSMEEVIGKSLFDFMEPEQVSIALQYMERRRQGIREQHDFVFRKKDGSRIHTSLATTPLMDEQGRYLGGIAAASDITERKQAEEALRFERDRAQRYLDLSGVMFVAIDTDQNITLVNRTACEVLGRKEEDILGRNWFDLAIPEEARDQIKAVFGGLMAGTVEIWKYVENKVVTARGDQRLIAWRNTILRNEKNEIIGTLSSGEDITERKRAEQELAEREKQVASLLEASEESRIALLGIIEDQKRTEEELTRYRNHLEELVEERTRALNQSQEQLRRAEHLASIGTLAAGIAHEINNPLGMMLLGTDLALDSLGNPEMVADMLRQQKRDIERCARIVRGVLDFARQRSLEKALLDLNEAVRNGLDFTREYAKQHGVKLEVRYAERLDPIRGNLTELEQVVMNLVYNAVQACRQGGNVTVEAGEEAGKARLVVRDDGRGMTPGQIEHAFDPFYTTRLEEGGTGLGLSTVHGIVTGHGGTIVIRSEFGKGSEFTVEFPIVSGTEAANGKNTGG